MSELEGQLALFDLNSEQPDEQCDGCPICEGVCEECGQHCSSSKECVELSGLYDDPA